MEHSDGHGGNDVSEGHLVYSGIFASTVHTKVTMIKR